MSNHGHCQLPSTWHEFSNSSLQRKELVPKIAGHNDMSSPTESTYLSYATFKTGARSFLLRAEQWATTPTFKQGQQL